MNIHNIIKVYKRDWKSIIKNPVACIIIAGLCVIPSLYAWVNIKACWNTYENTSTIPVAIVNNDKDVSFNGKKINIGRDVVDKLKSNHKIGWTFVNSRQADLGLVDGTYYAMIEIPSSFSSNFLSILSDNPQKPQITYKVDTKANPVAGKITEAAKNALVDQITTNFVSTVNESIFSSLNNVGKSAEENKEDIIKLKDSIIAVNGNMDAVTSALQTVNTNSDNLSLFLSNIKATMPAVENELDAVVKNNTDNIAYIKSTQSMLNKSLDNVSINLYFAQSSNNRISSLFKNLNESVSSANSAKFNSVISEINTEINAISNSIGITTDYLEQCNSIYSNSQISKSLQSLNGIDKINSNDNEALSYLKSISNANTIKKNELSNIIADLKKIQNYLIDEKSQFGNIQQQGNLASGVSKDIADSINDDISNINTNLINVLMQYNTNVKSNLNDINNNLITSIEDASALINTAKGLDKQIENLLNTSIEGTNLASKFSGDLNSKLLQFKSVISLLSDKLQLINNNDIAQIISILKSNPKFIGDFMSEPFTISDESINEVPNYGSSMAPIYTVLALWVGCLVLNSILKPEVGYFEGVEKLTLREKHFGKMLIYSTLAVIQGLIVVIGDKLILHVYTVNMPLMVAFAVVSSFTFSTITYTLVSTLENLGKAIAIVYMILQLAGSGGTYPIQVDPKIFRILQPLFPFTYSVGGFREAIAGPLMNSVLLDFAALFIFALISMICGFFLKEPLYKTVHKFEVKFKESGVGE